MLTSNHRGRGQEPVEIAADDLVGPPAENPLGGRIPVRDSTFGIHHDDRVVRRGENRPEPGFTIPQLREHGIGYPIEEQ